MRNKRNYINDSLNDGVETAEVEPTVLPEPKKRGRMPKPPTNESEIDKGGRPPLARNALVDDTAPVIRRSNRNKNNKLN